MRLLSLTLLAISFMAAGCGSGNRPTSLTGILPAPTETISLIEDLRLGAGDLFFVNPGRMAVDSDGRMYVTENDDPARIYIFNASGDSVGTLGRMGEGPGEYQSPGITMLLSDSIVVFDQRTDKILVYESDGNSRRTSGRILSGNNSSVGIIGLASNGWVVAENPNFSGNDDDGKFLAMRILDFGLTLGDTLLTVPTSEWLVLRTSNTISARSKPYGRRPFYAVTGDSIYTAWSESVVLEGVFSTGDPLPKLAVAYDPIPLTIAEKDEAFEEVGKDFRPQLVLADTRPAIESMIADDRGRIWIKVRLEVSDDVTHYWVVDPKKWEVRSATVSGNIRIQAIRDGLAYGVEYAPEGEVYVVRWRLES